MEELGDSDVFGSSAQNWRGRGWAAGEEANETGWLNFRAGLGRTRWKKGWRRVESQPLRTCCPEPLAIFAQESSLSYHLKAILFISCQTLSEGAAAGSS